MQQLTNAMCCVPHTRCCTRHMTLLLLCHRVCCSQPCDRELRRLSVIHRLCCYAWQQILEQQLYEQSVSY